MKYTKAEFKTRREALGLTPDFIAKRLGCHANIIWRIESPTRPGSKVSPEAAALLDQLAADFDMTAEAIAMNAQAGGVILRTGGRDALARTTPDMADWPERSYGLLIAEAQRRTNLPIDYPESE